MIKTQGGGLRGKIKKETGEEERLNLNRPSMKFSMQNQIFWNVPKIETGFWSCWSAIDWRPSINMKYTSMLGLYDLSYFYSDSRKSLWTLKPQTFKCLNAIALDRSCIWDEIKCFSSLISLFFIIFAQRLLMSWCFDDFYWIFAVSSRLVAWTTMNLFNLLQTKSVEKASALSRVSVYVCSFLFELCRCFSLPWQVFASFLRDVVRIVKMASEPEGIENV